MSAKVVQEETEAQEKKKNLIRKMFQFKEFLYGFFVFVHSAVGENSMMNEGRMGKRTE